MRPVIFVLAYLIFAPFVGALLDGIDRIISARMQRRKGPSILQPFYDLGKLFSKEMIAVNNVQLLLNLSYLVILMIAGSMLFAGADLLMVLFILSTADMFLIMAASSDSSPYANMGASREMLQMMAYEPLTLLVAVGFYLTTGSFQVSDFITREYSAVIWMPGLLFGFMFTTAIKFRKSPFDLSTSHHAHQEMVKGITTEMSGTTLAIMNIAEYYEMILLLGIFFLFFVNSTWWSWIVAFVICAVIFFMETLWDNVSARVKWKTLLYSCWVVTLVAGGVNILILMLIK
ncbi:NADH-quinone oxidoreductase subunit H [Mediterraneibacter glycyrrhizinilyticus]|uniref:respiratory chain complex I subunit 1 family protein n=1 Tax=Mediterraneibacter glycyrrhizinilyticus TaxID=342942 RepID=UPI0019611DD9|nr:complex I subunit 1 family protein [Mediterraneibacter glycyrrhizinilyticus]MBM6751038.1 NADH-quinone oxidoreductase subunit H [Mediterraneibacter glycyrrhizinilyticus]